jgi:hypothetical protein
VEQEIDFQLMNQALNEAQIYGEELMDTCSTISGHFQFGRNNEGIEMLRSFLDGIGCISQAIHLTQPVHQEKGLKIDLSELPDVLEPLVEALENQDYGLVGDILTYEVAPILEKWSSELEKSIN